MALQRSSKRSRSRPPLILCIIVGCGMALCLFCMHNFNMLLRISGARELAEISTDIKEVLDDDGIPAHAKLGVDPIYIDLFKKAKAKSEEDYGASHKDGEKGIVIGPTEGRFDYTLRALQNAKRIRRILAPASQENGEQLQLALMVSPEHLKILESCGTQRQQDAKTEKEGKIKEDEMKEACDLWEAGVLFDNVIPMHESEYKGNESHTNQDQGTSAFWLKALGGYRLAPYKHSLFIDADAYPCPRVEALFSLIDPTYKHGRKYWQLPSSRQGDFATGIEQWSTSDNEFWMPGDPQYLTDFRTFNVRNSGAVLWNFDRPLAHHFAHFIPLVSEHVYNNVATDKVKVLNDQTPFNVAIYLFHRFAPDFVEHQIPMHASCRAYPGRDYAGTDGHINGMLPLQQDGEHCSECSCSPCLVGHFASEWFLNIKGFKGWEPDIPDDISFND